MEDYRKKAQQKYLDQKKIKIEEDHQTPEEKLAKEKLAKEEEEKLAKETLEKQEKLDKLRVDQTKKQVYIQSQMLIVDESIDSFKTDKTDDNILMILTIIKASIENIQKMIGNDEKKILLDQVLKLTTEVDKNNTARPKGVNTIANVKILKDGFKQIYDLLNLNVDIQTLDTENDEKIARELEKELNTAKHPKFKHDFVEPDFDIGDVDIEDVDMDVPFVEPKAAAQPRNPVRVRDVDTDTDTDNDDVEVDHDHDEDDETMARKLQEQWNKAPKKESSKAPRATHRSNKYEGLNCEDFMKMLMSEKVSH